MAHPKSRHRAQLNIRISIPAKTWLQKQVPDKFPSYSAAVTHLVEEAMKSGLPGKK